MDVLTLGRTIGSYQSEGCDLQRSKDTVRLAESQTVVSGRVMGRVTDVAVVAAAPVFAGAGNGVYTPAAPGPASQAGDYKIRCTEKTADSGQFEVVRPDGTVDGFFVVGVAKATGDIRGTIADGAVDFDQTSEFTVTVTRTAGPHDGEVKAWVPTATDGSQIARSINYAPASTGAGETKLVVVHARECRVWRTELDFGAADATQIAKAISDLGRYGVIVA